MNSRDIINKLKNDGWILVHIQGGHHHYKHPRKPGRVTVPHPKKDANRNVTQHLQTGWLVMDR